ncbi:MAG TPA: phospho-N-acetylmuramoyl-pentapeptide-transferase [Myxococcota bacterium]|jgi:phospho-N-acetylmuramoyl-pentapeptide-transferase|nr:phospho-N-acetylmuramoyl-pentapeptide-transferase [Myxococcota bacterium]
MVYHLLFPLSWKIPALSWFRVFQYTSFRIVGAALTAILLGFVLSPWFIRRLQARQIGQVVRKDGPATHHVKAGTPTMGGSFIVFSVVTSTLLWGVLTNVYVWLALAVTVAYAAIGFLDDYLKLSRRNPQGLRASYKFGAQIVVAAAVVGALFLHYKFDPHLALPFVAPSRFMPYLGAYLYVAFGVIVVVGTSNAVNLTDGADGLAAVPVALNAFVYLILSYIAGTVLAFKVGGTWIDVNIAEYLRVPYIQGAGELAVLCAAVVGSCLVFLWYNTYPAQVFMGDVGALSLGGALGMVALLTKNEFLSVILGGIFVVEAVSVILQVGYFQLWGKKRGGKKILLMSPLHHHFELKGWSEPQVVVRFWIIQVFLALVALATLKLR